MTKEDAYSEYFSTHDLKERGWTVGLIKRFLPEHDDQRPNQMKMGRRRLPPVKLYLQDRVHQIEREDHFLEAQAKAADAKARAERASETRKAKREQAIIGAVEAFSPAVEILQLRKGSVRKAREPYLDLIDQTAQNIALELGLNKADILRVQHLLRERLDTLLAYAYDWYPAPTASTDSSKTQKTKSKKANKSKSDEVAQPSDWRQWDWD